MLGTSYTAEDGDVIVRVLAPGHAIHILPEQLRTVAAGGHQHIIAADYSALETALDNQISNIESTHPGYDEYRYDLAEIGHNPYELASYLTVLFEDYTRAEVQSTLQSLFAQQYTPSPT